MAVEGSAEPSSDSVLVGLDAAQREAVANPARLLAVIAAAGSGKTTVLARRIAWRVLQGDALARHVLALTFTRQAAGELRHRLRALGLAEPVEAGTFHAVAYRVLRQRARDVGQPEPAVATDRMRLLRDAAAQAGVPASAVASIATEIDWARARLVPTDEYSSAARAERRRADVPPTAVTATMEAYAEVKRRRGVLDLDDLLSDLLRALRADRPWAEAQRWRFRHLVVDEAQDMNPLQHALLEEWRGGRDDLMLVGDPRQAIYGWNGSDPALLVDVDARYPGITVVRLPTNRRSTPQIVRAAASVLAVAGMGDDSVAVRPEGGEVEAHAAADERAEAALVARLVIAHHRPDAAWSSIAVLTRTNAQLTPIAEALSRAGIPSTAPGRAASTPLAQAVAETHACRSREQLAAWADATLTDDGAPSERRLVAEALDVYLSRTGDRPGLSWRTWLELNSPFDHLAERDDTRGVALLTFHAAKGREWSVVVVAGAEDGLMPHSSAVRPQQREEEARLAYVALTRAADRAIVTYATTRNGRATRPSPFVADVVAASAEPIVPPPPLLRAVRPAVSDPVLVGLREWRAVAARATGADEQSILSDRALRAVAAARPRNVDEFAEAAGIGAITARRLWPRVEAVLR